MKAGIIVVRISSSEVRAIFLVSMANRLVTIYRVDFQKVIVIICVQAKNRDGRGGLQDNKQNLLIGKVVGPFVCIDIEGKTQEVYLSVRTNDTRTVSRLDGLSI